MPFVASAVTSDAVAHKQTLPMPIYISLRKDPTNKNTNKYLVYESS